MQTASELFLQFGLNSLLLLALTYVYRLSRPLTVQLRSPLRSLVEGVLFGLVTIIGIAAPPQVLPGITIDARGVVIGVAALYSGIATASVAGAMAVLYRVAVGGVGVFAGIGVVFGAMFIGYGLQVYMHRKKRQASPFNLLFFGLVLGLQHLVWVFVLPSDVLLETFTALLFPTLVIYPLLTLGFGVLLSRENREFELRDALQFSDAALKACADGVLVTSERGDVRLSNFAAACMFGFCDVGEEEAAISAMEGQSLPNLIAPPDQLKLQQYMQQVLSSPASPLAGKMLEVQGVQQNRSTFPIRVSVSRFDFRGTHGLVVVVRDVRDLLKIEAQARELYLEEQRIQMLQQFISDASHDLRTPITTLATSTYLLQKQLEDAEQFVHLLRSEGANQNNVLEAHARLDTWLNQFRARVATFNEQITQLKQLINDLLDVARSERMEAFRFASGDLALLIHQVAQTYRSLAQQSDITLDVQINPEDTPLIMQVDSTELTRALNNLVTNAIYYTPAGGRVQMKMRVERDSAIIEVQDTGIGIAPDELSHIFDRFYRAPGARRVRANGTGLGLTIVQQTVMAHGGQIEVESTLDMGSTFRLRLPIRLPLAPHPSGKHFSHE